MCMQILPCTPNPYQGQGAQKQKIQTHEEMQICICLVNRPILLQAKM